MLSILTLISVLLVLVIIWLIFRGYLSGQADLISWRNFFLLGFFQFYALAVLIMAPLEFPSTIYRAQGSGYVIMAVAMPLFLGLFLLANRAARDWTWPDRIVPKLNLPVTNIGILICIIGVSIPGLLALGFTGGGVQEGVIYMIRPGLACIASTLAFYLILTSPRNPFYWGIFIPLFAFAVVISTVGSIDRRNFLGVFFAIPWMWYYSRLRYAPPKRVFTLITLAAAATFLCLVIYNAGRQTKAWRGDVSERADVLVELAKKPDFSRRNILTELIFQDTPINTLAILENYPERFPYMPFHGAYYYFVNPIPRTFYSNKPEALGIILQRQLSVEGANLGPGVIGHGWCEASWFGVIYYALGLGALTAMVDHLARARAHNPYFLAIVGASLGNVLGLARGETSLFLVIITSAGVSGFGIMWILGMVFRPYMRAGASAQLVLAADAPEDAPLHDSVDLDVPDHSTQPA